MSDTRAKNTALAILSGKRVKDVELDLLAAYVLARELDPGKLGPVMDAALAERRAKGEAAFKRKLDRLGRRG